MPLGADIYLGDSVSATLMDITNGLHTTNTAAQNVQATMTQGIDGSAFNAVTQNVNNTTTAVEGLNKQIQPLWNTQSHLEIFDASGATRLQSEMDSLASATDAVLKAQQNIGEQALRMKVLPPEASWDINFINQRVEELATKLSGLQNQDISFVNDAGINQLNSEYEGMRANLNNIINLQAQMNQAIEQGDVSSLNSGFTQLSNAAEQLEKSIRSNVYAIQEMNNIQWNSPQSVDVFTGSGIERYKQEIQSANEMINKLSASQQVIAGQAASTNLFPANMVNDVTNINNRINTLSASILKIQNNPINSVNAAQASNEVERLRTQLNQAVIAQSDLNTAMQDMDISAANAAYDRLNGIIIQTEQNIRDNTDSQGQFNRSIDDGATKANGLVQKISAAVAAYATIQGAGKILDASDDITNTMARLNNMNDGLQTTVELNDKIFLSAQRSRAEYSTTADMISKLGTQAKKAFSSNDELITFSELLNKSFAVDGTTTQGIESVTYNLTQAMASGVLRGQDLNAVFSNTPSIIQNIADYLNVPIGEIRDLASEGELSAEVVKNAMLAASTEINTAFESMPMTFAQIGNSIKNNFLMEFQPVLTRLNEIGNSDAFNNVVSKLTSSFTVLAGIATEVVDMLVNGANWVIDNWSVISPFIYGVITALAVYAGYLAVTNGIELVSKGIKIVSCIASYAKAAATGAEASATAMATAAQYGFNTALLACPITWIIIIIIALIAAFYMLISWINKTSDTSVSATGIIFGAFYALGAFLWNLFLGLLDLVLGVINYMVNPFIQIANFIGNVFENPVSSVIYLFQGMADGVLAMLQKIASAIDFVFGSNMADTVGGWRDGLKDMADNAVTKYAPDENYQKIINELDLSVAGLGLERWAYSDAYASGYSTGERVEEKIKNFDLASFFDTNIPDAEDYLGQTADNTAAIKNAVTDTAENIKYLRDIAERGAIDRYTLSTVNLSFGDINNNVNSDVDLDGIVSYIGDHVAERVQVAAEGISE